VRNTFFVLFSSALLLGSAVKNLALEMTWEFSVQLSANVQTFPPQITLIWPQDQYTVPNSYTVYRKASIDSSWTRLTSLAGSATSYSDNNVVAGTANEYQVVKSTSQYTGYGYIYSGINLPMTDSRGKLLLVVDNTYAANLAAELARLQQDLVGDGWTVIRIDVSRNDTPVNVKDLIKGRYMADPSNVKTVFIFGHVPVPYSGDIVPDGHVPDHRGAWPCDGYYGDMDGTWTDSTVNDTSGNYARNRNVPGDGKFDQSSFPAKIKLMVGRVDLANMPGVVYYGGPSTFPSELELLRNYLDKDHKFRTKQFDLPRRGIVGDQFGTRDGEAFCASGYRNFAPFFGADNITTMPTEGIWMPTLTTTPYLWAYGSGAGSFASVGGLGSATPYNSVLTRDIYNNDIKAVFTLLFGSWFGDWDSEDNIMRGVLAAPSYGLTCAWSGRPHWFLHHMALGEPIGFATRLTQNNGPGGLYQNQVNSSAGQIHVALMGDPTLRMHVVAPPASLSATTNSGVVTLNWPPASDSVVGYHVYRADSSGAFTRLTTSSVAATSYQDTTVGANYMVRSVKLETSSSGTYYNPSAGAFLNSIGSGRSNSNPATSTNVTIWMDDTLPAGAIPGADGGDSWNWVGNPKPISGAFASQSSLSSGSHQLFFSGASQGLTINPGDILYAYVYLDAANPPSEVMLQWNDGMWDHRAYWGANNINYGVAGTTSRAYIGTLPAPGQWVRLQVPASRVGLEGRTLNGMAFSLFDGRATWDNAGKFSGTFPDTSTAGPKLSIVKQGANVVLSWPSAFSDFILESATGSNFTTGWASVPNVPVLQDGQFVVTNSLGVGSKFYRLKK
jgi:hypothetical protein